MPAQPAPPQWYGFRPPPAPPQSPWAAFPPPNGGYLITPMFGRLAANSLNLTNNWTVIAPMVFPWDLTFDRVGVHVATAVASTSVYPLVYEADEWGLPTRLIRNWGAIASTSTGLKELVVDDTLPAGVYWIGLLQTGGATVALRSATNTFPWNSSGSNAAANAGRIDISSGSTPVPVLFGGQRVASSGSDQAPVVLFRARSYVQ